jgi:hypothetical protein
MTLPAVLERFGELLHARLDSDSFTTEDSVRYTFYAALLEKGGIDGHNVIMEYRHPSIPGAKVDTWIPNFHGSGLAVEFKYDRDIPSGRNSPRTQKAGKVFHDLYRLGKIEPSFRRVFIYLTGQEMAGYFGNPINGLFRFFMLPSGESLAIDAAFVSGKSATFTASVGEVPNVSVTGLYAQTLPRLHHVRAYEVKNVPPRATAG